MIHTPLLSVVTICTCKIFTQRSSKHLQLTLLQRNFSPIKYGALPSEPSSSQFMTSPFLLSDSCQKPRCHLYFSFPYHPHTSQLIYNFLIVVIQTSNYKIILLHSCQMLYSYIHRGPYNVIVIVLSSWYHLMKLREELNIFYLPMYLLIQCSLYKILNMIFPL